MDPKTRISGQSFANAEATQQRRRRRCAGPHSRNSLSPVLQLIMATACAAQRQPLLLELFNAFLAATEHVLLSHDPWRIYTAQMVRRRARAPR